VAKPQFDSGFPRNADGEASGDQREAHVTQTSQPPSTGFGLTIVKIALVMLSVETLIMLGFNWFGVQLLGWRLALVDAGLLAVIVATIAYFAFIRPKDRQIRAIMASLEKERRNAENLARFDALTGVLSRRALLEALDVEVARAKRYGSALACLMLDLDHFKAINDNYGHPFGDRVLHLIAQVISEHCRTNDHLGRYGGEEFLIILPETRIDGATTLAERVRSAVAETSLGQNDERITLSIGVAEWRDGDGSAKRLIAQADRALLEAKSAGRNRILTSQPA
jgi:diguanylate cyclase (GGDEF)-like protein